jgi:lipopolysaccharide export system protein LptC
MRPFVLSFSACFLVLSAAWAQTGSDSGNMPQIPYGQSYKNFEFPLYEGGELKYKLTATEATGVSLNRAEVTNMKIEVYDEGKVTTTITSPNADLYSTDRRMRTRNTVRIERSDTTATAQRCDFDLVTKQYVLRDHVRVILKNFDASAGLGPSANHASSSPATPQPAFVPASPASAHPDDSLLSSPGAYSNSTNVGPNSPAGPASQ